MDYDNLLKLVKNTRSIRRFKPDPIPDEFIYKMIDIILAKPIVEVMHFLVIEIAVAYKAEIVELKVEMRWVIV